MIWKGPVRLGCVRLYGVRKDKARLIAGKVRKYVRSDKRYLWRYYYNQ